MTDLPEPVAHVDGNLQALVLLVGRIDGKMDQVIQNNAAQDVRLARLDQRVVVLENNVLANRSFMRGIVWLGAPLLTIAGGFAHIIAEKLIH